MAYEQKKRKYPPGKGGYAKKYKGAKRSIGTQTIITSNRRTGGYGNMESKFFDSTKLSTNLSDDSWAGGEIDPAGNCLNYPDTGTGEQEKIGRKYTITGLLVRGVVNRAVASDQADCRGPSIVRIAVVLDKQANGATLNAEDVFVDAGVRPLQFRNLEYAQRFTVLWNEVFTLRDGVAGTDGANTLSLAGTSCSFLCAKSNLNIPVLAPGVAGSIADVQSNALHVIGCSNSAHDYVSYQARIRFIG